MTKGNEKDPSATRVEDIKPHSWDASANQLISRLQSAALRHDSVKENLDSTTDGALGVMKEIGQRFAYIAEKLGTADKKSKEGPLGPNWAAFRKEFTNLMTESQRLAQSMADDISRFNTFVTQPALDLLSSETVSERSIQTMTDGIGPFTEDGRKNEAAADSLKNKYLDLQMRMQVFADRLSKEYGTTTSDALSTQIKKDEKRKDKLQSDQPGLSQTARDRWIKVALATGAVIVIVGGLIYVGPVAIVAAVPKLAGWVPTAKVMSICGAGVVCALIIWGGKAEFDSRSNQRSVSKLEESTQDLKQQDVDWGSLQKEIQRMAETDIPLVISNIMNFELVWGCVARACQSAHEALERFRTRVEGDRRPVLPSTIHDCTQASVISVYTVRSLERFARGLRSGPSTWWHCDWR